MKLTTISQFYYEQPHSPHKWFIHLFFDQSLLAAPIWCVCQIKFPCTTTKSHKDGGKALTKGQGSSTRVQ